MARSQEERQTALETAADIFRQHGYDNCSIEDVVLATGFNRYALYQEFGGKRDLFLNALDAYCKNRRQLFAAALEGENADPLAAIITIFEFRIEENAQHKAGCLLFDIAPELVRDDKGIAERIDQYLDLVEAMHVKALELAQSRGELNPSITPAEGGALMRTFLVGLGSQMNSGANKAKLKKAFYTLLTLISAPYTDLSKKMAAAKRNLQMA